MQITLTEDPRVRDRAAASGFRSVEEYVRHLVQQDISGQAIQEPTRLPRAEWRRQFDALLQLAEPGNPNLDDSREGIYADRIAKLTSDADSR